MATNAISAIGTTAVFDGLNLGEIGSMSPSGRSCNVISYFSTDSTNGFVDKLPGQLDEGELTVDMVYDGSAAGVYNSLNTKYLAKTSGTLLITFNVGADQSTYSCTAFISNLDKPGFSAADGEVRHSVTFAISGKATFTDDVA